MAPVLLREATGNLLPATPTKPETATNLDPATSLETAMNLETAMDLDTAASFDTSGNLDTVRALCHDLRQPLATILLLAGARSGDAERRLDGITLQAQWLLDMVEGVIGGAAGDPPERVDVVDLASRCVLRSQATVDCEIGFIGTHHAETIAPPMALSRALTCVLDNAVRAAGPGGHVMVEVTGSAHEITIRVVDDGPGFGNVPTDNSLGLTITRALVSACGGGFELTPGAAGGVVARIVLPGVSSTSLAS